MALLQAKSNSDLKSAPFATKIGVYRDSPYVLTQQVASVDHWDADQIVIRQNKLADMAVETWPLAVRS